MKWGVPVLIEGSHNFVPDYLVLGRIGKEFFQKGRVRKTQLQLTSRVNWHLFCEYVNWLKRNEFIRSEQEEKIEYFFLTERGIEMFSALTKFTDCLQSNVRSAS